MNLKYLNQILMKKILKMIQLLYLVEMLCKLE